MVETPNFIELGTVEEANQVNIAKYRLSESMSAKRGCYVFLKRAR